MSHFAKILLTLCVIAGFSVGFSHKFSHDSHDECSHAHSSEKGSHSHDDGDSDTDSTCHHHACCHLPAADRPLGDLVLASAFHSILVEIAADNSAMPVGPVYSLDKPPLI